MIVDDIARKIRRMTDRIWAEDPDREPRFAVYVDELTYREMLMEIRGPVSAVAMELVEKKTLHGHKVYRVIGHDGHGWKVFELPSPAPSSLARALADREEG